MSRYNRCKECYNMDCIFVTGEREDIDTSECADFRSMTNADRIRSMTDEELAEFMRPWNSGCPRWKENPLPCSDWDNCGECWLKWLKEEVSE